MQNLNMPLDQAFNVVDGTLAQVNTNRDNHALITAAVQRIKNEITYLKQEIEALIKEHHETLSLNANPLDPSPDSNPS
jgi:hypothetical protein